MNTIKIFSLLGFASLSMIININCDDRVPDAAASSNATLEITALQAIADTENQESVGEIVAGSSKMRIIAVLTNDSGQPLKDKEITFSYNSSGGNFSEGSSATTDENGQVINIFRPNSSENKVDNSSSPSFDGMIVTLRYGTSLTAKAEFNVYPDQDAVWPYKMIVNTDVDNIKLDNGITTAQIETQVFNKTNAPLQNMILSFSSDKGYIDSEGTTDSTGSITLTFTDNGTQSDIGLANIVCSYNHPTFGNISDSAQVTIGTDNGLSLQILPITYDATNSTVVVGEDISGDVSYTRLIATVTDTNGNAISGIPIEFTVKSGNVDVGTITYANEVSNTLGQVVAEFDDGGNVYKDNPGTPNYEGVSVFATFGDKVTSTQNFDVYEIDDVWPYNLILGTDTDVIALDGGATSANISARLLNKIGNPIRNAQINYESTLGSIIATGFTDSLGADTVVFSDLGNPDDVGVSDIKSTFSHPGFEQEYIQDSLQVFIEDPSFQSCAFMEIPSSNPGRIVVRDGGGIESTIIRAEVYDDNGNLINTPTPVIFSMEPRIGDAYLDTPDEDPETATVYTVNGVASVSVNSGTDPGPIRVEATCDCDQDGTVDLTTVDVPVIIASGAPYHIEAEYDPNATEAIGGGFYQTECAAIISDIHYNPVEDSTYVYWSIDPLPPDTLIDAFVEGVSFTNNEGVLSGTSTAGVARSTIVYSTDAIGSIGRVRALTFGGDNDNDGVSGDSVYSYINEDEGDATLFFLPGQVSLIASATYHDFTLGSAAAPANQPALIEITAIVVDFYGNAVVDAPVSFTGTGVSNFYEVYYENYADIGVNGAGVGDGCFSWRDYGRDDDPQTLDWGTNNDNHDGFDLDGDGFVDSTESSEISEPFSDFGFDGVEDTFDEGEGDGEWYGYHMIGCEPIVKTDENGYAKIIVEFDQALCTLANQDDDTNECTWDDFTASLSATLLIPEITTSDPLDILLVRSPDTCD